MVNGMFKLGGDPFASERWTCLWRASTSLRSGRHQGPWQGLRRGEIEKLKLEYRLDLTEYGYVLVRSGVAAFKPEMASVS